MAEKPLIVGNWKMNGLRSDARALARALVECHFDRPAQADIVLCPPVIHLAEIAEESRIAGIALGAQDCHWEDCGARTGDVSAPMLRDAGASYVILGHSERRFGHGETDTAILRKVEAAHRAGLIALVCLGETRAQHEAGYTREIIARQFSACLPDSATQANTVLAYEPVWAIGTGLVPSGAEIEAAHAGLDELARMRWGAGFGRLRILYGGSVNPGNSAALLALEGVGGLLVGGASLNATDFWKIVSAAPRRPSEDLSAIRAKPWAGLFEPVIAKIRGGNHV